MAVLGGPISVRVLLLVRWNAIQVLFALHLSFILHLSIYLSYPIRYFEISCAHVHSPTTNHRDLRLGDQFLGNGIVKVSDEPKASRRLRDWVSDDLALFNFAKLSKVTSKILISQSIIKTSNKHFVSDRPVMFSIQLVQFTIVPFLVKPQIRMPLSALRPRFALFSVFLFVGRGPLAVTSTPVFLRIRLLSSILLYFVRRPTLLLLLVPCLKRILVLRADRVSRAAPRPTSGPSVPALLTPRRGPLTPLAALIPIALPVPVAGLLAFPLTPPGLFLLHLLIPFDDEGILGFASIALSDLYGSILNLVGLLGLHHLLVELPDGLRLGKIGVLAEFLHLFQSGVNYECDEGEATASP